jgi:hypothetical protein
MVKVENLERLKAKIARMTPAAKREMRAAIVKNADEFYATVARIVPKSDKAPHLASTLTKHAGSHELEVAVSIGGPEAPYPAHLEWGHIAPDGSRVPAEPFWYTTLRAGKPRWDNRSKRAAKKAVTAV